MNTDAILIKVIEQAKTLKIPVSDKILPEVKLNTRAKTRFGCCKKLAQGYLIELCERVVQSGENACCEVLAHEILHTCPNCSNHGKAWQYYADLMNRTYGYNIKRTHKSEELGVLSEYTPKYALKCQNCGAVITRMKKSPLIKHYRRYRCRCGGELKPVKQRHPF